MLGRPTEEVKDPNDIDSNFKLNIKRAATVQDNKRLIGLSGAPLPRLPTLKVKKGDMEYQNNHQ